jgi:lipoprotein-anchoring transpeptidase ErfK/SrfK
MTVERLPLALVVTAAVVPLVQGGGRALRYGVGVGRQDFGWLGAATIHDKREWPDWYPPKEMIQRSCRWSTVGLCRGCELTLFKRSEAS